MDVDETGGNHSALCVKRVLTRAGRTNLGDDTVFNQDTCLLGWGEPAEPTWAMTPSSIRTHACSAGASNNLQLVTSNLSVILILTGQG
jgi:hypothetical protein